MFERHEVPGSPLAPLPCPACHLLPLVRPGRLRHSGPEVVSCHTGIYTGLSLTSVCPGCCSPGCGTSWQTSYWCLNWNDRRHESWLLPDLSSLLSQAVAVQEVEGRVHVLVGPVALHDLSSVPQFLPMQSNEVSGDILWRHNWPSYQQVQCSSTVDFQSLWAESNK